MKLIHSLMETLTLFATLSGIAFAASAEKATVIITNARVYTVNAKQPWAEAVAIGGDKILAVGSKKAIDAFHSKNTRIIDAHGKLVLPGFTDSHIHFLEGSRVLTQVDLNGTTSIAEVQKRLREYAAAHPKAGWILGRGWSYEIFGEAGLPNKKYLDEVGVLLCDWQYGSHTRLELRVDRNRAGS